MESANIVPSPFPLELGWMTVTFRHVVVRIASVDLNDFIQSSRTRRVDKRQHGGDPVDWDEETKQLQL